MVKQPSGAFYFTSTSRGLCERWVAVDIPDDLAAWTYKTVLEIVEKHEYEPGRFDYKTALNGTSEKKEDKDEHLASIRRTVCAMANTGGGFILFGVRDHRQKVSKAQDRVVGIPAYGDHRRDFAHKIEAIQPEVHFDASPILLRERDDAETGIFVVAIPESPIRPHMVGSTGVFYRRGDGGNAVHMSVYEVRDQMLFTQDRLAMIMFFRIRLVRFHGLAATMNGFYPNYRSCIERFDVAGYDSLLVSVISSLPTDYIMERLIVISERTSTVNHGIDRVMYTVPGPGTPVFERGIITQQKAGSDLVFGSVQPGLIQSLLWDIQRCCRESEERLVQVFGPLPPGFELRYTSSS